MGINIRLFYFFCSFLSKLFDNAAFRSQTLNPTLRMRKQKTETEQQTETTEPLASRRRDDDAALPIVAMTSRLP